MKLCDPYDFFDDFDEPEPLLFLPYMKFRSELGIYPVSGKLVEPCIM